MLIVHVPSTSGQQASNESKASQADDIAIYDANGARSKNCHIVSATSISRIVVPNTRSDGPFIPAEADLDTHVRSEMESKLTALKNTHGILSHEYFNQLAHLVVSEDGKQATFVPFEYSGNVQLRHCGKLKLDTSSLSVNTLLETTGNGFGFYHPEVY